MGRKLFDGKDTKIVIQKLEEVWAVGGSDAEAAFFADISKASLSDFLKHNPKITERKERLKERPVLSARNTLHKVIQAGDGDLALKYLERKRFNEFSLKQEINHTGNLSISLGAIEKKL